MTKASPVKLRTGEWGARAPAGVAAGDTVTIVTASGKSWDARIERVVWTDGTIAICATSGLDRPAARSLGRDSAGNSVRSGESYAAGVTAPHGRTCPMCGSRECTRAWNPRDLCDED